MIADARRFAGHCMRRLTAGRLRRQGVDVPADVRIYGLPIISLHPASSIKIGNRTVLCSSARHTALGVSRPVILRTLSPSAVIVIGSDVGLSGTTVCSTKSVRVGDRCLIGADVIIGDTDFHPVDMVPRRYESIPAPADNDSILIGDDVFIGARSIILKGSTIGDGAVIGAGSIVTGTVPDYSIYAGSPARFIRMVEGY